MNNSVKNMNYKVKIWNDSIEDFQIWEYPYLETAMMMANKLAHRIKTKVFIIEKGKKDIIVVESAD